MKRPAFQFYPADWRKDMALQSCSIAARGLWIDMLCIAHECEPYGHLTVNGKPMTPAQIGRHTGLTERECAKLVAELDDAGVISRTEADVIFSRRMVRDEVFREQRAEIARANGHKGAEHGLKGAPFGALGGRPKGGNNPPKDPPSEPGQNPRPSSSSSSSSSKNTPKPPREGGDAGPEFERFWVAYPRKVAKDAALMAFAKRKPDNFLVSQMIAAIERQGLAERCQRGESQYVPHPATWLNEGRWKDEPADLHPGGDKPAWALVAGFSNRFDAENAGCNERNAGQFQAGKRLENA